MTTTWRRKPNRLGPDQYVGNRAYMATSVCADRGSFFGNEEVVTYCLTALESAAAIELFDVLAYVFMPDHLHLLVWGVEDSSLPSLMKRFKQDTAFWFKQRTGTALWQKSYHDHIVRVQEDLDDMALYIASNPVRAGLVEDWPDFLNAGGLMLQRAAGAGDLKVAATGG